MSGSSDSFLWYKAVARLVVFLDVVEHRTILLALQLFARRSTRECRPLELIRRYVVRSDGCHFVEIVAQGPRFHKLEKQTLQSLQVCVVEDPEVQRLVDRHTFTFAPSWGSDEEILAQPRNLRPILHAGTDIMSLLAKQTALLELDGCGSLTGGLYSIIFWR